MRNLLQSSGFWKIATLALLALFVFNQTNSGSNHIRGNRNGTENSFVKTANASEVYPMFTCPCCGEPLNKEEPCCGAMIEMIEHIDEQVALDLSEDEVVLSTAKKFGIDRLTSEEDQLALKQTLIDLAPEDAPKIELSEVSRDLGSVSQAQGDVSTDFEFANVGESDLLINKLSSSCGCTSAAIVHEGKVGPSFTMAGHGQENPTDWEVAIKPGDQAVLRVYYDPSVHADLEGAVTRTVSIFSNDPVDFEVKVTITLDQAK